VPAQILPRDLVRMSIGIEDVKDILADIEQVRVVVFFVCGSTLLHKNGSSQSIQISVCTFVHDSYLHDDFM
jgi:hypothetical protein